MVFSGELLRAEAPGRPSGPPESFYLQRARGRNLRFVTVMEFAPPRTQVREVRVRGDMIEIDTASGTDRHRFAGRDWEIVTSAGRVSLGGRAMTPPHFDPLLSLDRPTHATGSAWRVDDIPHLNGTLDGFDLSEPLRLELEDQYRRSEEAYAGPEDFSALCYANWDDDALYLAIDVVKADRVFHPEDAAPKLLDNEPDEIHSDGIQVYLSTHGAGEEEWIGFLIVPDPSGSGLRARTVSNGGGDARAVRGAWRATEDGYRLTLAIPWPEGFVKHAGGRIGFDLIVNEMEPDRDRRAGQLVWSGGGGWVWLQGDRQDPSRFGVLELVG